MRRLSRRTQRAQALLTPAPTSLLLSSYIHPASLLSTEPATHVIDFEHDEPESLDAITMPLSFVCARAALCHGLAAWFTVDFNGSTTRSTLDTGPSAPGTHWCVGGERRRGERAAPCRTVLHVGTVPADPAP